ncbi:MAG: SIR2 family NAD-dependent protein deacylase [Paludibacteraceae bacterium]
MKRIVVFTGAGMSADSGIATFRDSDGLWANYRIEEVCTPEALSNNREKVIDFYNQRRKEMLEKEPNAAHIALAKLEQAGKFDVQIVTQNIDNLHERAGSRNVTHLHGELTKLRSSLNELDTVPINGWKQDPLLRHADGSLLRPFVVFFGENVPMLNRAVEIARRADVFVVIGSSLQVYPAASLLHFIRKDIPLFVVDPKPLDLKEIPNPTQSITTRAAEGVPLLVDYFLEKF